MAATQLWFWRAWYSDGTFLDEAQGTSFQHIDQSRLVMIQWVPTHPLVVAPAVRIPPDGRLILYRRVANDVRQSVENEDELEDLGGRMLYVIGWQKTIAEKNQKTFLVLFEDGSIVMTDDDSNIQP